MNNRHISEEIGNNKVKTGNLGHILHGGFKRYRSDKKFDGEGFCQGHGGYSIKDGNLMSSLGGNEGCDVFFDDGGRTILCLAGKRNGRIYSRVWEMGVFRNEEIGQVFGIFYSAVSQIVRDVNEQIKNDHRVGSKVKRVNPHFKM